MTVHYKLNTNIHYKKEKDHMSLFAPSTFGVGGGLIDDVDVVVKEAKITNFDYNGTQAPVPAIMFTLGIPDAEDVVQYWTVGKSSDWMPSEDEKKLVAIGRATQLNASSNGALMLASLVNSGFPEDKIVDDITCFQGLEGHMTRVPAPKRGMVKAPRADGKVYEDTVLTFASISKMPWEKVKGKAAAAPKAGTKAAPKAAPAPKPEESGDGDDIESKVQNILLEILSEVEGGIKKQQIPGLLFKKAAADPDKQAMIQIAFKEDFLSSGPWTYEKGLLSL